MMPVSHEITPRIHKMRVNILSHPGYLFWVLIYIYGHNFVKAKNKTEAILKDTQSSDSFLIVAYFDLI